MKNVRHNKSGMWDRVHGPDLQPKHAERHEAMKNRMNDQIFKDACSKANIQTTKRQARKWNNNKGAAFKVAHNIQMDGFGEKPE